MRRSLVVLALTLLASAPALAGPEVPELQLSAGAMTTRDAPFNISDDGPVLRLAAGLSFGGHAVGLGLRLDSTRSSLGNGRDGQLFAYYRSPSLQLAWGLGLAALADVRSGTFHSYPTISNPDAQDRHRPILGVGLGLTIPFEWLLVMPAFELAGALPHTEEASWLVIPEATLTLSLRHDREAGARLPSLGLHPAIALGLLGGASTHPLADHTKALPAAPELGANLDLELGGEDWVGILRTLASPGVDGLGFLAMVGRSLGGIGERAVVRGLLGLGPAVVEQCGGDVCSMGPSPLAQAELQVVWYFGSFQLRTGATVFGGVKERFESSRMLAGALTGAIGWGARPD